MKTAIELAREVGGVLLIGNPDTPICGVTHDSRNVKHGDLFAVLRGAVSDGKEYVREAISKGAVALLVDKKLDYDIVQIEVSDIRSVLGIAAAICYDKPTEKLKLVGVTGTNGKTTIVYLVENVLKALGRNPGVISTVSCRYGQESWDAGFTTPEATVIQSAASKMLTGGASHLITEASSHGIAQHRLNGCFFEVAAFTNLSQDHLDFHKTMDAYGAEKLRLFTEILPINKNGKCVINIDDSFSEKILKYVQRNVITVSVAENSAADIRPNKSPKLSIDGIEADIITPFGVYSLQSPLMGLHNLSNILVALGICIQLGEDTEKAIKALNCNGAPGRLERVLGNENSPAVLVDYAHTPDALVNVLNAVRPITKGRLICVFGCGGDRDTKKRPLMGTAVRQNADIAIVTSDNPRTENPDSIIDMIIPGLIDPDIQKVEIGKLISVSRGFAVEPDRRLAIRAAISAANKDDTVLIAGKGHEDYQILGKTKIHFDDRQEAAYALTLCRKET